MQSKTAPSFKSLISAFSIIVCVAIYTYFNFQLFLQNSSELERKDTNDKISVEELVTNLSQDDPRILNYIRKHHLSPPSTLDYNLEKPGVDGGVKIGITPVIKKILNNKKNGFFIEAGSNDGERASSTLGFERFDGWSGLCVEPSPIQILKWKKKNRKAWLADVCLSPTTIPMGFDFFHNFGDTLGSKIGTKEEIIGHRDPKNWKDFKIPCFPVYSLLKALNVSEVDYFNLDVEGVEYEVLKTIPFDRILIRTISVEPHVPKEHAKEFAKKVTRFLEAQGYISVKEGAQKDYIFAHNSTGYKAQVPTTATTQKPTTKNTKMVST